jgi:hypothetical protein
MRLLYDRCICTSLKEVSYYKQPIINTKNLWISEYCVMFPLSNRPRWSSGSVLATGPKVRGFKPGRGDGFLRVIKIRSTTSFGGEVKPSVPCRRFTACKRTLQA